MRRMLLLVAVSLCSAFILSAAAGSAGSVQARWVIRDLDTLDSDRSSSASGINAWGQVVGWSGTGQVGHAFLWKGGRMIVLGTLPGDAESDAVAINDRGQVIGRSGTTRAFVWQSGRMIATKMTEAIAVNGRGQVVGKGTRGQAVLWQGGELRDLGSLGGASNAFAINERGQVVGSSDIKTGPKTDRQRAFLWKQGRMKNLGTLTRGHNSGAVAINGSGEIVGWSENDVLVRRAVLWDSGRAIDLGMLPGFTHSATSGVAAINDLGQVVGTCQQRAWQGSAPKKQHGFLWEGGTLTDLGTLPGDVASDATGINEQGMIIGMSYKRRTFDGLVGYHAFVWQDGTMTRLPTLPGGSATGATDINEKGQIVGWATAKNGDGHAVLWTLRSG